ncbi:hypothetical protein, partial [Roseiflexus sp.]|uniref:hypothetical protein n=1 Tax=Roseiflexus sp. TaxID=2562120 RepID=UPI00398B67FB
RQHRSSLVGCAGGSPASRFSRGVRGRLVGIAVLSWGARASCPHPEVLSWLRGRLVGIAVLS